MDFAYPFFYLFIFLRLQICMKNLKKITIIWKIVFLMLDFDIKFLTFFLGALDSKML